MSIRIRRLSNALGGEILDVDLRRPLDGETVAEIRSAWLEHQVLLFRNQDITPEQHIVFTRQLGEPERSNALSHYNHPQYPEIFMVTNHLIDGRPSETRNTGRQWHSDLSYTLRPAAGSLLHAREIPEVGGDTMFANMVRAYEGLSEPMRNFLDPLWAVNDFANSHDIKKRDPEVVARMMERTPPVAQPVVRVHPETHRKALYVSEAATGSFIGLAAAESRAILDMLFAASVEPENLYRHRWQLHDLVLWDNRCIMHIALADYEHSSPRHMFRTTLTGTPSGYALTRGARAAAA